MIPARLAHHIFRRLTHGDSLLGQHGQQLSYSGCSPVTGLAVRTVEGERASPTHRRSCPVFANLIQVRTMSADSSKPPAGASTSTSPPPSPPSSSSSTSSSPAGVTGKQNRLALERSPYLLQHATNPVDWYPWCEEAFDKARRENKLIFLSVGYSTCHWCHVMEKESFEDAGVAALMNRHYVNIKVDREERPDVDRVYMSFIQATSGSGGWPMSVFLTPDLEPISGGTYFPPEDRWGRPGFRTVLASIAERWGRDRATVAQSGRHVLSVLRRASQRGLRAPPAGDSPGAGVPGPDTWLRCVEQLGRSYEPEFGGFSEAPKFPQPANFNLLFHAYSRDRRSEPGRRALDMALHTLRCMARGGLHDHVGCGFARYSTDTRWHVPHFEKMLYDQAQLAVAYCDAFLATKDEFFADVVRGVLRYVARDLAHPAGGFYSAEDADSLPEEGAASKREGAFCVWRHGDVVRHLPGHAGAVALADLFCFHYGVQEAGNVDPAKDPHGELTGQNVLIVQGSEEATAEHFGLPLQQVRDALDQCRQTLFQVRRARPRPHLDSKILTAWNGLMISAFAKAGQVLKDPAYVERAAFAARFIKDNLYNSDHSLTRCCYRDHDAHIVQNSVPIMGFLDDYAFLIRGLLDLYESSFDTAWLEWAETLQGQQDIKFWDEENGGYFTSPEGDPSVLIRVKEDQDGAEPSGNSVAAHNLLRIAAYLGRADLRAKAERLLTTFADRLRTIPIALPEMTSALMAYHDSPPQVFIVGPRSDPATEALLDVVRSHLLPGRLLVQGDGPQGRCGLLYSRLEILNRLRPQGGRPTAYVCRHYACSLPVTEPGDLVDLLQADLRTH